VCQRRRAGTRDGAHLLVLVDHDQHGLPSELERPAIHDARGHDVDPRKQVRRLLHRRLPILPEHVYTGCAHGHYALPRARVKVVHERVERARRRAAERDERSGPISQRQQLTGHDACGGAVRVEARSPAEAQQLLPHDGPGGAVEREDAAGGRREEYELAQPERVARERARIRRGRERTRGLCEARREGLEVRGKAA
jgi:hypothetical protein